MPGYQNRNFLNSTIRNKSDHAFWDMTLPGLFSNLNTIGTLHRFHSTGHRYVSLTVANDSCHDPQEVFNRIVYIETAVEKDPSRLMIARSAKEIRQARLENKLAISFNLQGTNPFAEDISWVEPFAKRGVTHALLAYNKNNAVAGGCADAELLGLTRFGKLLVNELNRVGVLLDGSHSSYLATMEAIQYSNHPFIFSHSNASGVYKHYRNIRDDQIMACKDSNGVVGINGVGAFLQVNGAVTPEIIFRHIDYVASLAGPAHVGLSLDFIERTDVFAERVRDSDSEWPENEGKKVVFEEFAPPEIIWPVISLMEGHGYSEDQIEAVLWRNFLRVFEEVIG